MGYRIEEVRDRPEHWPRFLVKGDDGVVGEFKHHEHADAFCAMLNRPQPAGPTVRVKVAVETNADGEFAVVGWGDESYVAPSRVHAGWAMSIIEANVPIPQRVEPAVVEGTVVE